MSEGPISILILDDDQEILQSFRMLLQMFKGKYEADFFNRPQEALEAITTNPNKYHVVLTDIQMPEMNGVKFVATIRKFLPKLPILFMTGFTSEESKKNAMEHENVVF
ncbi:MAG: response regulator, partial [Candidatus Omnitrophica bacterium]|nr:response regulator [Candidatus Omnitrophota bacterium]